MFLTGFLQSSIRGASKSAVAAPPSLQYSTQDVMMVLVNMQKEAQRREASLQRSLMQLKQSLQTQVSDEDGLVYGGAVASWLVRSSPDRRSGLDSSPGGRFSKAPETFRARKAIAKSRTLRLQSCFSRIF